MKCIKLWGAIFVFLFNLNALYSVEFYFRGTLEQQFSQYYTKNDTLLNPNQKLFSNASAQYNIEPNFVYEIKDDWVRLVLKSRVSLKQTDANQVGKAIIDNLFFDFTLQPELFVTIGKFNLLQGVGLSYNPSNFLDGQRVADYSKSEEKQKEDQEGLYLTKLEWLQDGYSLSTILIPKITGVQETNTGLLAKLSLSLGNYDYSINYFQTDYPLMGLTAATTIGDGMEIHGEIGIKKGSQQQTITIGNEIIPNTGVFINKVSPLNSNYGLYVKSLIGASYTFESKANCILEYYHNQEGLNDREWGDFTGIVSVNHGYYLSPPFGLSSGLFAQNLSMANSIMNYRYMRQNYLFLRYSQPDFLSYLDSTFGLILNLDDGSFVAMPTINYAFDEGAILGMSWSIYLGKPDSEFGLVPWHNEGRVSLTYYM